MNYRPDPTLSLAAQHKALLKVSVDAMSPTDYIEFLKLRTAIADRLKAEEDRTKKRGRYYADGFRISTVNHPVA